MNPYLKLLSENQDFRKVLLEIAKEAPIVPSHRPDRDNTEEWKARSAERRGFSLCLLKLGFNLEDL